MRSLGVAAGLGAVSGLRSLQALAWVSRELSGRRRRRGDGTLERWLGDRWVYRALAVVAAGEMAVDKLPGLPDRVSGGPLLGRGVIGALVGAVAAGSDQRAAGAVVGSAAAIAAAFAASYLRREAGRLTMVPDAAVAMVEDAVAVAAAKDLVAQL